MPGYKRTTSSGNLQPLDSDLSTIAGLTPTTDNMIQAVASAWASRTPAQVKTVLALVVGTNVQAWDTDLDAIAALSAANDDIVQRKSGVWTNRTLAQYKTDLLSSRYTFYHNDDFASGSTTSALIGELSWALSAATWTVQAVTAGHVGVGRIAIAASAGTVGLISTAASGSGPILATETFDMTFIIKLVDNDSDTQVRVGLNGSHADPSSNGIYFEKLYADTSWFGVTRSGGSQTRTAAVAATSTNWCVMRIRRVDASTVGFTIDGGTEVTATATVPVAVVQPIVQIKNQTAVAKSIDVDYYELMITGLSR